MDIASNATRWYGTWAQLSGTSTADVEAWVAGCIPDSPDNYDVDEIVRAVFTELNTHLPDGVTLEGEEVVGPAQGEANDAFTEDTLQDALAEVDIYDIIENHQRG